MQAHWRVIIILRYAATLPYLPQNRRPEAQECEDGDDEPCFPESLQHAKDLPAESQEGGLYAPQGGPEEHVLCEAELPVESGVGIEDDEEGVRHDQGDESEDAEEVIPAEPAAAVADVEAAEG